MGEGWGREGGEGGEGQSSPTLGNAFSPLDFTLYRTGSRRYFTVFSGKLSPKCFAKRLRHSVLLA